MLLASAVTSCTKDFSEDCHPEKRTPVITYVSIAPFAEHGGALSRCLLSTSRSNRERSRSLPLYLSSSPPPPFPLSVDLPKRPQRTFLGAHSQHTSSRNLSTRFPAPLQAISVSTATSLPLFPPQLALLHLHTQPPPFLFCNAQRQDLCPYAPPISEGARGDPSKHPSNPARRSHHAKFDVHRSGRNSQRRTSWNMLS